MPKWSRFQYDAFQCFIFDSFWESQNATFLGNIPLALDLHLCGYLCRSKKFNDVSSTLWLICEKSINSSSTQQERLTQVLYNLTSLSQVNSNGLFISTEPTIVARTRVWAHCTKTTPFRRSKISPRSLVGFRRSLPNSLNSTLIRIRNGFVL